MSMPLRFTAADVIRAADAWRFNCGPAALCAVLDLTPDEIRPNMGNFEKKGYTNPSLMVEALTNCGAIFRQTYRSDHGGDPLPIVSHGLVRVQWGGPWTKPGVPMRVRYRKSHWVAVRNRNAEVFDVNAIAVGGWIPWVKWTDILVPWIISELVKGGDGTWWPTHVIEVEGT